MKSEKGNSLSRDLARLQISSISKEQTESSVLIKDLFGEESLVSDETRMELGSETDKEYYENSTAKITQSLSGSDVKTNVSHDKENIAPTTTEQKSESKKRPREIRTGDGYDFRNKRRKINETSNPQAKEPRYPLRSLTKKTT